MTHDEWSATSPYPPNNVSIYQDSLFITCRDNSSFFGSFPSCLQPRETACGQRLVMSDLADHLHISSRLLQPLLHTSDLSFIVLEVSYYPLEHFIMFTAMRDNLSKTSFICNKQSSRLLTTSRLLQASPCTLKAPVHYHKRHFILSTVVRDRLATPCFICNKWSAHTHPVHTTSTFSLCIKHVLFIAFEASYS